MSFDLGFSLYKLEIFCRVVEEGGVVRAAQQMYLAQPVVSTHIRSLEKHVGCTLFDRNGRGMSLTPEGEAVYAWSTETLTRAAELEREVEGILDGEGGAVTVGASMTIASYLLPSIVRDFCDRSPRTVVSLFPSASEQALGAVARGMADFAVIYRDQPPDPRVFDAELLGHEELLFVVGKGSGLVNRTITVEEARRFAYVGAAVASRTDGSLSQHTFLEYGGRGGGNLVEAQLVRAGLTDLNVVIKLGHPEGIKDFVRNGHGVTVLQRSAVKQELATGELRQLQTVGIDLAIPVYAARQKHKRLSIPQQHLYDVIRTGVAAEIEPEEAASEP